MDDLAQNGFDVWSLDYLGYGDSSRYPESTAPHPGGASECAGQLADAARYILRRQSAKNLVVIGDSFGTVVAGIFATRTPELLQKLVLSAPVTPALQPKPADTSQSDQYNFVAAEDFADLYSTWVPKGKSTGIDRNFFLKDWRTAYLGTDPESQRRNPPSVKVPSGPGIDVAQASAGQFPYDPSKIQAPTLVIYGEWDSIATDEGGKRLFDLLTGAKSKSRVVIGNATHVPQFESARFQLYSIVRAFLDNRE
jgi:pimeloyl-ACP methyl ester carboxylesterase